jgi:segregation and condensation protein B
MQEHDQKDGTSEQIAEATAEASTIENALPHADFEEISGDPADIQRELNEIAVRELASEEADDEERLEGATAEDVMSTSDELPVDPELTAEESLPQDNFAAYHEKCSLPLKAQVEAILFASPKCQQPDEIAALIATQEPDLVEQIQVIVQELLWEYQGRGGGFRLEHIKGHGYQFRTAKDAAPLMKRLFASRPRPLSRASMETLAIIAYKQPCTRAEIEFVRGVDAGNTIKHLLERNFITCVGRKEEAGRPMLFGTTQEFLQVFNFSNIRDLPPLTSFQASLETVAQGEEALMQKEESMDGLEGDFMAAGDSYEPTASEGLMADEATIESSEVAISEPIETTAMVESSEQIETAEFETSELIETTAEQAAEEDDIPAMSAVVEADIRAIQGATKAESFDDEDPEFKMSFDVGSKEKEEKSDQLPPVSEESADDELDY